MKNKFLKYLSFIIFIVLLILTIKLLNQISAAYNNQNNLINSYRKIDTLLLSLDTINIPDTALIKFLENAKKEIDYNNYMCSTEKFPKSVELKLYLLYGLILSMILIPVLIIRNIKD